MPNRRFPVPFLLSPLIFLALSTGVCRAQSEGELAAARTLMVESELATAGIKDRAILAVMRDVPRHRFVPPASRRYAYHDMSLPIGHGQTISPPFIVAQMTQQLALKPQDNVLEVGTGSGYQAAVLSRLVKEVHTVEIVEELAARATKTFEELGYANIHARMGDGFLGWPEAAPFDKIIVTCSPERVPKPLVEQLREGGRIVIPVGERYQQLLCTFTKRDDKLVVESREPTYFVPMTGSAESLREKLPTGAATRVVNGDFEQLLERGIPAGWYYVRQAAIEQSLARPPGKQCMRFSNAVPGWNSQAMQSIGMDGREVSELAVEVWVQAKEVRGGELPHQQARLLIHFFDENRAPLPQGEVGPWHGNFAWARQQATVDVPSQARGATIVLGLLGATGTLWCDDLTIRASPASTARK
ncbi:MAG: protein-L-isoaspartate(D-aspartate) O-methyltransferase [Pirellulales bacterium]